MAYGLLAISFPVRAHRLPLTPQRRKEHRVLPHAVLEEILALLSLEGQVHLLRKAERRAVLLVDHRVDPVRAQLLEREIRCLEVAQIWALLQHTSLSSMFFCTSVRHR